MKQRMAGTCRRMAKYVLVNSFGTAQMLEIIRDHKLPIQKVSCCQFSGCLQWRVQRSALSMGMLSPLLRPAEQLRAGDFSVHLSGLREGNHVHADTGKSLPGGGETVYAF